MIPLIVVFKKEKSLTDYLNNFIDKNKISKNLIFEVKPQKEEIGISQIREIKKIIDIKTKNKKLFIFYSFNKATLESQNAFLKTLEEKTENSIFLLTASSPYQILPTIISRAKIVYLDKNIIYKQEKKEINIDSLMSKKNNFHFFADNLFIIESKDKGKEILFSLIHQLYDLQKENTNFNISPLIKKGIELLNLLEESNLSPQLTIDNYLILIKKAFIFYNNHR